MDKNDLSNQLDDLGSSLMIAAENGLFKTDANGIQEQIDAALKHAIDQLSKPDPTPQELAEAEKELIQAEFLFNKVWNTAKWWRLRFEWAVVHLVSALFSVVLITPFLVYVASTYETFIPAFVGWSGVAGATLHSIYWHVKKAHRRLLRRVWSVGCVAGAFIGYLLAIAIYIAMRALLAVTASDKPPTPNEYVVALLCFFAGYNWEWALSKLEASIRTVESKFEGKT